MSQTAAATVPGTTPTTTRRVGRVLVWLLSVTVLLFICQTLGIDIVAWLERLWDTITQISPAYLVAGLVLQTAQTAFTGYAYYSILRFGYPQARFTLMQILTVYAVSVAMNGVLPANLGTLALFFLLIMIVAGATFAGVFGVYLVQKIFFTVAGAFVYLYLFLSVPGSFDLQLGNEKDHPFIVLAVLGGIVLGIAILVRFAWRWLKKLWNQAKQGGAILSEPRTYLVRVFLPEFGGWLAKLGVIAVFLAAYSIPVTFHTVMSVVGGNSLANVVSFTPGGVGVNQAINGASLSSVTDTTTAVAYSTAQQLITTGWNILLAIVLVALIFGWKGGSTMVRTSYSQAKDKAGEMNEERARKKAEKKAAHADG